MSLEIFEKVQKLQCFMSFTTLYNFILVTF